MESVVLLSGGVDSSTCLAIALSTRQPQDVLAVTVEYGQRHAVEVEHARAVADFYGVGHEVVTLPRIFGHGESTLIEGGPPTPKVSYEELAAGRSPAYVPFRNGVLLSVATAIADGVGASWLYFGAHSEDAERWAYPDCTPEFIGAMANAVYVGTGMGTRLITPLQWMDKKAVVNTGLTLGVPYDRTLSCYEGREPACGECPTCRSRYQAFLDNGVEDPIQYARRPSQGFLTSDMS